VNGHRVTAPEPLRNRDVIGTGTVTFIFHDTALAESTVTVHR
jgi:hypothetical protein